MQSPTDVLVIGAGVAGCAVATAFARQGRTVLVVERNLQAPDRIVGELLQPGGVAALTKLGLGHCLDGIEATPVEGYHLFWKGEEATFWFCPMPHGGTSTEGDEAPAGRSFNHGKFVSRLRGALALEANVMLLKATAVKLLRQEATGAVVGAVCSRNGSVREKYYASLTVLADGSGSNFRSQFSAYRPKSESRFWGLEMVDAKLPRQGYAFSVLGSGPPILMYQISARETRILIDIPDKIHAQLKSTQEVRRYIQQFVIPTIPETLQPSLERAINGGRLRSMPNARLPSTRNVTPGVFMLGDACNMRHPMTGAGMTVALKDAVLLAELLSPNHVASLEDIPAVLEKMRHFHWRRKTYSASLNILADALYLLFVSKDQALRIMQRGFISYVQEGEKNFAAPAWLMGGLVDDPLALFRHFLSIATYSICLHLKQASWLGLPVALFQSLCVLFFAFGTIWRPLLDELRA